MRATVYRPDLGGLLPVYVPDRYDGIEARPFPELSDAEVERYLERNVAAVREVAERARPEVALANHLVMGPVVLARALAATSPTRSRSTARALEYTVKPHPRFLPYAREGLAPARAVLVGSRHTAESLWAAMDDPELSSADAARAARRRHRAVRPARARGGTARGSRALVERVRDGPGEARPAPPSRATPAPPPTRWRGSTRDRDRLVVFVGKLIASKGVELLLAAWPLVLARVPDARLVVVGFGGFRAGPRAARGRPRARRPRGGARDARRARGAAASCCRPSSTASTTRPRGRYLEAAAALPARVTWVGRLEHDELADLLPAAEAKVVPSTFPEAFGMVAAEAAACGALPVVARHSGLAEVAATLAGGRARGRAAAAGLRARAAGGARAGRGADRLAGGAGRRCARAAREAMVAVTRERYSWEGVARDVLAAAAASRGASDGLAAPA